jgi:hypothetical protein
MKMICKRCGNKGLKFKENEKETWFECKKRSCTYKKFFELDPNPFPNDKEEFTINFNNVSYRVILWRDDKETVIVQKRKGEEETHRFDLKIRLKPDISKKEFDECINAITVVNIKCKRCKSKMYKHILRDDCSSFCIECNFVRYFYGNSVSFQYYSGNYTITIYKDRTNIYDHVKDSHVELLYQLPFDLTSEKIDKLIILA